MAAEIRIYEEHSKLLWSMIVLVGGAFGIVYLNRLLFTEETYMIILHGIISFSAFFFAVKGVLKVAENLYHFVFYVKDKQLHIDVYKGDPFIKNLQYPLAAIDQLSFRSSRRRGPEEALLDYSTSYYLMVKTMDDINPHPMIEVDGNFFSLKVDDISRIIKYIRRHNPNIDVPEPDRSFLNIRSY